MHCTSLCQRPVQWLPLHPPRVVWCNRSPCATFFDHQSFCPLSATGSEQGTVQGKPRMHANHWFATRGASDVVLLDAAMLLLRPRGTQGHLASAISSASCCGAVASQAGTATLKKRRSGSKLVNLSQISVFSRSVGTGVPSPPRQMPQTRWMGQERQTGRCRSEKSGVTSTTGVYVVFCPSLGCN